MKNKNVKNCTQGDEKSLILESDQSGVEIPFPDSDGKGAWLIRISKETFMGLMQNEDSRKHFANIEADLNGASTKEREKMNNQRTKTCQTDWRKQVFSILISKLPNGKSNTCEQEYEYFQKYSELIRYHSEEFQKYLIWELLEGNLDTKSDYHEINLTEHRDQVVYEEIALLGVPTNTLNDEQLAMVEKIVDFILAYQKSK